MTGEKEQAEAKERKREIAMKNLTEKGLLNYALTYFVDESKDFGEADNSAVEKFKYLPTIEGNSKNYDLETGKEGNLLVDSLLGSRQNGKRYTGNISEYKIIEDASKIIKASLERIKIGDILQLMGSDPKIAKGYSNVYLSDIMQSKDNEAKKFANMIIDSYLTYFTSNGVSDSLSQRAKTVKKGLETLLTEAVPSDNTSEVLFQRKYDLKGVQIK